MRGRAARKVMIVDDDATSRAILCQMLIDANFDVVEAGSGEDALMIAEYEQLDGILMDISMPGMGGIEACRRFRSKERYRATPILFVTSFTDSGKLKEAFSAGGDDFINKPTNALVLQARLHGHMQRAEYFYELENLRRNLYRYVSTRTQEMVELYTETGILPPPEHHDVCIMFTDIRDFTSLSQKIDANDLFATLGRHLGNQVDLVYRYGGYVDKFGGDGIMAVFEGDDKCVRACRCALDIIEMSEQQWDSTHAMHFKIGIGLHNGEAILGNIGSSEHLDYSVISNTVNIAARLCGQAMPMSIVASASVRDEIGNQQELRFDDPREVMIKGVDKAIPITTLLRNRNC